jgi:hypothetical protein
MVYTVYDEESNMPVRPIFVDVSRPLAAIAGNRIKHTRNCSRKGQSFLCAPYSALESVGAVVWCAGADGQPSPGVVPLHSEVAPMYAVQ